MSENVFDFDIPNLDDVEASPQDYREAADVLLILADYLEAKGNARDFRLRGMIDAAQYCEQTANRLYQQLPDWAKW